MKVKLLNFSVGFLSCLVMCLFINKMAITVEAAPGYTIAQSSYPVTLNGLEVAVDAVSINDKTYLPIRQIGDLTGTSVQWNANKKQIDIKQTKATNNMSNFAKVNLKVYGTNKVIATIKDKKDIYINTTQLEKLLENVSITPSGSDAIEITQNSSWLITKDSKGKKYIDIGFLNRYQVAGIPYMLSYDSGFAGFEKPDGSKATLDCPMDRSGGRGMELDEFIKHIAPNLSKIMTANEKYLNDQYKK